MRRPVDSYIQPAVGSEILVSSTIYGESLASPEATNHRGRVYRSYGVDGEANTPGFDFKGLPTSRSGPNSSSASTPARHHLLEAVTHAPLDVCSA